VTELFVSQNKTLEELNLNDCRLGPEGAAILGRSLRRNQKICKLYLSQNRFEDRGLHHILEGILDNIQTSAQLSGDKIIVSPIQEVDLSKNGIELVNHTVLKTLCSILTCQESNMQMLSLRDNLIRDDPADAINVALKVNMSLLKF
jgi:Ran GTPase-activating protein (RanGAP) involved in mRNA processing and transport